MTPTGILPIAKSRFRAKYIDNQNGTYDVHLIDPISGQDVTVKEQVPTAVIIRFLDECIDNAKRSLGKE